MQNHYYSKQILAILKIFDHRESEAKCLIGPGLNETNLPQNNWVVALILKAIEIDISIHASS